MKRWMFTAVLFAMLVVIAAPAPASAAGIIVSQDGLSDKTLSVPVGEPVSWIDLTGKAVRIAFPDVQGAPVIKDFAGRGVHVVFDRPGKYPYSLTVTTPGRMGELAGEITVR